MKDNLMPIQEVNSRRTREQHSEDSKRAGIASGEARRRKKTMQELAKHILSMSLTNGEVNSIEDIQNLAELKGKNLSVDEAIIIKQVEKALKGDIKSAEFIRDTSGQKPREEISVSGELNNPYSELTVEELRKLAGD